MCGIVGYIGHRQAYPILIKGLQRLEYRGYDSAGIALLDGDIMNYKRKGKVADLEDFCKDKNITSSIGIGHTRWATHGVPNDVNAHPHYSKDKSISIIHNGIIENYESIKKALIKRGHQFESDTDTEVLVHLIEEIQKKENTSLFESVRLALNEVVGAYAIAVIANDITDEIIVAKKGSPLVVGVGEGEFFIASDATPIIEYTKEVVYLEEGEVARLSLKDGFELKTIENVPLTPYVQELEMSLEAIEKGGYEHFMLKEIFEQPQSITDTFRGRLISTSHPISISSLKRYYEVFKNANRIIFISCGTSWHSSLLAEYYFEELLRIPVEVEYASEFRYRNPVINKGDIVIPISQSGETADTLAAIKMAKEKGAFLYGICNVVGSSIARETHTGIYTHAGSEIGVASTKAFSCQISLLLLMALSLGNKFGTINQKRYLRILKELENLPKTIEKVLKSNDIIESISEKYLDSQNFLYLGRGYHFPIALEGALKLKEISYIHAEGYPAAEMKHGPIALIDKNMPVVVIATKKGNYHKVVSNIMEIKARGGKIIAVVSEGDQEIEKLSDQIIEIPNCDELIAPILANIPLQLLSYHIANKKGCNVDQPRNLAKSVTVE